MSEVVWDEGAEIERLKAMKTPTTHAAIDADELRALRRLIGLMYYEIGKAEDRRNRVDEVERSEAECPRCHRQRHDRDCAEDECPMVLADK